MSQMTTAESSGSLELTEEAAGRILCDDALPKTCGTDGLKYLHS